MLVLAPLVLIGERSIASRPVADTFMRARFPAPVSDRWWAAAFPDSMTGHCVMWLSHRIEEGRLGRAVRLALDADPILGCQFVDQWFHPYWRRDPAVDSLPYFKVTPSPNLEGDIRSFLSAPSECPLQVVLLRGESDVLGLKIDHRVGDGRALLDCAYSLAEIYTHLGADPEYRPVPKVTGVRSLMQVGGCFSVLEKWRIAQHIRQFSREAKKLGEWRYPVPRKGQAPDYDYQSWRLGVAEVRAMFNYGAQRGATISQVLLAAFCLAAAEVLPPSPDSFLPLNIAVDLRRYLPGAKASTVCNLVGNSVITFDPRAHTTMDTLVKAIRDQTKSQQRYLGLATGPFAFEALPVIRQLVSLVPYSWLRRKYKRYREQALTKEFTGSVVLLTHAGDLDHDRLTFGDVVVVDGFLAVGMTTTPGFLSLTVSGFKGSLALHLGTGPRVLMTRMAEHMKVLLPTRATASAAKA